MTDVAIQPESTTSQIPFVFQYTVEAYKTFQKLAENLPNPMSAAMFEKFAEEERQHRDLLDMRYLSLPDSMRMKITLGNDLRFQDILEGDISYRNTIEMLIVRERTMEKRLIELARTHAAEGANLYLYLAGSKKAHVALLEREMQLIRLHPDWFRREDAQYLIVHGGSV